MSPLSRINLFRDKPSPKPVIGDPRERSSGSTYRDRAGVHVLWTLRQKEVRAHGDDLGEDG